MTLSLNERELLVRLTALVRDPALLDPVALARERSYCWSALRGLAKLDVMGMGIPVDQGGLGCSFQFQSALAEALARIDFGFALAVVNSARTATKLAAEAHPSVVEKSVPGLLSGQYVGCTALTEPGMGSDFAAIETRAEKTRKGWVINGRKAWIINAAVARVIVLYAQTDPGSGARGIASFVIDAEHKGFGREPAFGLAQQNTFGLGGFSLENYEVSDLELLQPPGLAFKSAMASINGARTYVAAMACGMVAECLDIALAYGTQRHSFGKRLREHQGWRWPLAEAATELAAARHLVQAASACIDSGADAQLEAAQAKLFATRMAESQIPALEQSMGAQGLHEQLPFGRHQFAARAAHLVDGSSEMLRERIFARIAA